MSERMHEASVARVREVLAAARRIVDGKDPLGVEARKQLPGVTGLSIEGVELALARHVETDATTGELEALVARAGAAATVHVVLSANVFVGAVRALALAVAATPNVRVRPSSREAVLAPLLVRALDDGQASARVRIVDRLEAAPGDEIHVYGRAETIEQIRREAPGGVRVRGHGPGFGVALLGAGAALEDAAQRLSWDIVPFDQRGCLSPRVALVEGDDDVVREFAGHLAAQLDRRGREVPRGLLGDDERQAFALYRKTLQAIGECREGNSFAVGVALDTDALLLPPPGRNIHVTRAATADEARRLITSFAGAVTCVGHAGESALLRQLTELAPHARRLPLGQMQRPPLDGPVDLRRMV